jgi:hypothetical protein
MAGLVPAIPLRRAQCVPKRDARHKAGHDNLRPCSAACSCSGRILSSPPATGADTVVRTVSRADRPARAARDAWWRDCPTPTRVTRGPGGDNFAA